MNSFVPFVSSSPPPFEDNIDEEYNDFKSAHFHTFNLDSSPVKDYLQDIVVETDNVSPFKDVNQQSNVFIKNTFLESINRINDNNSLEFNNLNSTKSLDNVKIETISVLSNSGIFLNDLGTDCDINSINKDNNNYSSTNDFSVYNIKHIDISNISNQSEVEDDAILNNNSPNKITTNDELVADHHVDYNLNDGVSCSKFADKILFTHCLPNTTLIDNDALAKSISQDVIPINDKILNDSNIIGMFVNNFSKELICDNINNDVVISNCVNNDEQNLKNAFNLSNTVLNKKIIEKNISDSLDGLGKNISVHGSDDGDEWTNFDSEPINDIKINLISLPILNDSDFIHKPENTEKNIIYNDSIDIENLKSIDIGKDIDDLSKKNLESIDKYVTNIETINRDVEEKQIPDISNAINNCSLVEGTVDKIYNEIINSSKFIELDTFNYDICKSDKFNKSKKKKVPTATLR